MTKVAHRFLFAKCKYLKDSFVLDEQLKLSSWGIFLLIIAFSVELTSCEEPILLPHQISLVCMTFCLYLNCFLPSLTFFLSLWRSHNSWATLQKEFNTSQLRTLSLWDSRTMLRLKSGSLEVFVERCQWIVQALSPVQLHLAAPCVFGRPRFHVFYLPMSLLSVWLSWLSAKPGCRKKRCSLTSSAVFRKFVKKASWTQPCPWTCLVLPASDLSK